MNLRDMITDLYPELGEKYASEQYKLSQEIIEKKLQLKICQTQMAFLMGVPFNTWKVVLRTFLYLIIFILWKP
ncbi:hypothetical protein ACSS31_26840 (plasmid) [Priestia megaterium]